MAEIVLFHHGHGLTSGIRDFAETLRGSGHVVHLPDMYDGRVFDDLDAGLAYAREVGFDVVAERGRSVVEALPAELVYGGFSLGVMAAQELAQTRPGARAALLLHSCLPPSEFGEWPDGVPVQIHGMDGDPYFAGEGDIDAARELVASTADAELFVYPGDQHLFTDSSLPAYHERAAAQLMERVLALLDRVDAGG